MKILEGTVDNILVTQGEFVKVFVLKNEYYSERVVGTFTGIDIGSTVEVEGEPGFDDRYGNEFRAGRLSVIRTANENMMISFLSSGSVKGVGRKMAERIVERFGEDTFRIIEDSPDELLKIQGIGKKKLKTIVDSFNNSSCEKDIIMFLSPYDVTPNMCHRIYKIYGENSINQIRKNPYEMVETVRGIGFRTADEIGLKSGIAPDSKFRIDQGIIHVLTVATNNGHLYLPEEDMMKEAIGILSVEREKIEDRVYELVMEGKIVLKKYDDTVCVYLRKNYETEDKVAYDIISISENETDNINIDIDEEIEKFQKRDAIKLAQRQKDAIRASFENGFTVVTGGPGTGKTTTINAIINLFLKNSKKVLLAAPTGRAAKRMTETTGMEAKTIHRLLEMSFDVEDRYVFMKNEDEPLDADVVIVDEASMIDMFLMKNLLNAIGKRTRLILVGDADQLPSVGAGNVLRNIISSDVVKTVKLNEIFRQAQESNIVMNAHRINQGMGILKNDSKKDFFFMKAEKEQDIMDLIRELVSKRLPQYYNLDPLRDIQVLSPMRKGNVGVMNMNIELQKVLNPHKNSRSEVKVNKRIFRIDDKVMQTKNNYSKKWEAEYTTETGEGIYNGDIGYVYHIDRASEMLYVKFDDYKIYKYKFTELDEIEHCFCTTVHKSQGSEFRAVIMPMTFGAPMLLTRNLLYTAITRAKELVVVVGNYRAMEMMINNNFDNNRYSNLDIKLREYSKVI